jgi:hypothetical protein
MALSRRQAARDPAKAAGLSAGHGWVDLFNGKDLSGWKTHPDQPGRWEVEDGAIVSRGSETSHLFSERGDYENFHLRVEALVNAGGNSGVYFRSEYGLNRIAGRYPEGYEAQIFTGGGSEKQLTGSLHGLAPVTDRLVDADEWFTMEVIAHGQRVTILLNGKRVVDFVDRKGTYTRGHLALQQSGPGTVVRFRRIEIQELPLR